jgi:hypothetical protein
MMELRQADKGEVQGDMQYAENANIGATYSMLELSVIIETEKDRGREREREH